MAFYRRMTTSLFMGISAGTPFWLMGGTLSAWLTEKHLSLTAIGFFGLAKLPYSTKFLWAPLMDRYQLPFLGRRRGWLLVTQIAIMFAILALAQTDPTQSLERFAAIAILVTFFSASQDIVIDAYRREALPDNELAAGASMYVGGYRVAKITADAGALILATFMPWETVYAYMALSMGVGVLATIFSPEPKVELAPPKSLSEAVVGPLVDFLKNTRRVWVVVLFILFYKFGDNLAGNMAMPFYLKMEYSKPAIAGIVKLWGISALIAGGVVAGMIMIRMPIRRALFLFGILQALSNLGFAFLHHADKTLLNLGIVISLENFAVGMSTAAFVAFLMSITNKKYTATQYALLTSIMSASVHLLGSFSGMIAEKVFDQNWSSYFIFCTAVGLAGLIPIKFISQGPDKNIDESLRDVQPAPRSS